MAGQSAFFCGLGTTDAAHPDRFCPRPWIPEARWGARQVPLDEVCLASEEPGVDLVALEHALTRLGETDARKSKVVELRFFGGLTVDETAEVLQISGETVMRDWSVARAWLLRELDQGMSHGA